MTPLPSPVFPGAWSDGDALSPRGRVLPATEGHVRIEAGPELAALDARALADGSVLELAGCSGLLSVALPSDRSVEVRIERALDAVPLRLHGSVGVVAGRLGPYDLVPAELPASRRVGRGGYVGPAAGAPPEVAVRICVGDGALAAAATGPRGLVRIALGDTTGARFQLGPEVEPPALVQLEACPALEEVAIRTVVSRLRIGGSGALKRVDGSGARADLIASGQPDRLDALGTWKHLVLEDCPSAEVRVTTRRLYPRRFAGRIVALRSARLLAGEPPPLLDAGVRRSGRDEAEGTPLPADRAWRDQVFRAATGEEAALREAALHLFPRAGYGARSRLPELARMLAEGVAIERLWAVRTLLASSAQAEEDPPWAVHGAHRARRTWGGTLPDDEVGWRARRADLSLLEAAVASADPGVAAEADALADSLVAGVTLRDLRLLALARAERVAVGRPVAWVDGLLDRMLAEPPPGGSEAAMPDELLPYRDVSEPDLLAHGYRLVALLPDTATDARGERWLDRFLVWLHHAGAGPVGLALIAETARRGSATARRLLAEAALKGGAWSPDVRAQALRTLLAGVQPARGRPSAGS